MVDDKLLRIESMPQIKLGFTQMGLDDVNHINKYIDDNIHHQAMPVSRECYELRTNVVFKCNIVEENKSD